jgi:Fic family protein
MATSFIIKDRLKKLKSDYDRMRGGKDSLLQLLDGVEISEMVYNSNAIENSTLTLRETEKILLEMDLSRNVSLREVFETKNLARIIEYIKKKSQEAELTKSLILILHEMLIGNIEDSIAGRFRIKGEYVRVGTYIAPSPEHIDKILDDLIIEYSSDFNNYFLDKIAKFHLEFELIHPFNDGNGRMGRVIINYQLQRLGFPGIIIRDKEKKDYYTAFNKYIENKDTIGMEKVITLALLESFHKRLSYIRGETIIPITEYAKSIGKNIRTVLNAAKRQTVPAFREKGVWKIGSK